MTENHFSTVPGIDSQKPLSEYTIGELENEIKVYENEIKCRGLLGICEGWYSNFLTSWLKKCREELNNRRPVKLKLEDSPVWKQGELF